MTQLWVPGQEGPHSGFVERLNVRIAEVSDTPYVEVELVDGSRLTISSIEPEPGYGFVTLSPTRADGPAALVVPLGSIRRIEVSRSEEERSQPGFAVS